MDPNLKNNELQVRRNQNNSNTQDEDTESNVSFGSNDDDPILTATITFDVTVDPNGQVISTSEGQIIAESIQNPSSVDNRRELSHIDQQHAEATSPTASVVERTLSPTSTTGDNQSGLLATIDTQQPVVRRHRNLQDSLEQDQSDSDESTSTESLIERSKKYMNQEAGIIILKREDSAPKNFNINLDFDLNNKDENETASKKSSATNTVNADEDEDYDDDEEDPKGFNINLDFDLNNKNADEEEDEYDDENAPKGFNINLDFDLDPKQSGRNTGVDIDLMITSDTKVEITETVNDEDDRERSVEENEDDPGRHSRDKHISIFLNNSKLILFHSFLLFFFKKSNLQRLSSY